MPKMKKLRGRFYGKDCPAHRFKKTDRWIGMKCVGLDCKNHAACEMTFKKNWRTK